MDALVEAARQRKAEAEQLRLAREETEHQRLISQQELARNLRAQIIPQFLAAMYQAGNPGIELLTSGSWLFGRFGWKLIDMTYQDYPYGNEGHGGAFGGRLTGAIIVLLRDGYPFSLNVEPATATPLTLGGTGLEAPITERLAELIAEHGLLWPGEVTKTDTEPSPEVAISATEGQRRRRRRRRRGN